MDEQWRPVTGHERRYSVSSLGRVMSTAGQYAGRIYTGRTATNGYLYIDLYSDGSKTRALVHRLVAEAFIGQPKPEAPWVNHRDGNKRNNAVDNLEWTSPGGNNAHAYRTGLKTPTDVRGERNPRAKLSADQVAEIRRLSGEVGQRRLALMFGVSRSTIQWVQKGRNWPSEWPEDLRVQEFPR